LHFAGYRANNLLNLRMKKCNKRACLKTFYSPPYKNNHSPIRCNKPQSTQFPTHHRKSHRRHQSTIETSQVPNSLYTSGSLNMSAAPTKIYSSEPISWCDEHAGILVFLGVFVAILLVVAVLAAKQFIKDKKERRRQNDLERQDLRGTQSRWEERRGSLNRMHPGRMNSHPEERRWVILGLTLDLRIGINEYSRNDAGDESYGVKVIGSSNRAARAPRFITYGSG
jgi:hypothetical protein